jgi:GDP-L-fucose synthase
MEADGVLGWHRPVTDRTQPQPGLRATVPLTAPSVELRSARSAGLVVIRHVSQSAQAWCLGSSCIYPRLAEQPMPEEALLTGLLEPTNEPYAIAKIAGIKLC